MKLVPVMICLVLGSCEPNAKKTLEIPCCDEHGECFSEESEAPWEIETEGEDTGTIQP